MSLHWKMNTNFPFKKVFVLGIILFFLGISSMIIAIIAFVTESWGHYVATGMWGGASILASGSTAIFASRLKSLASVKVLLICAVITTFTTLTMLILSAGGLSLNSGFYERVDASEYNKRTSNLVHASLLVISVFCLSGNILAVIVCCKYLFFEPYDKSKHRRRHRHLSEGNVRVCSTLRGGAPNISNVRSSNGRPHQLQVSETAMRRNSENNGINRVQIEYRRSHRRSASDHPFLQQLNLPSQSRRNRHSQVEITELASTSFPSVHGSRHRREQHSSSRANMNKQSKNNNDLERPSGSSRHVSSRIRSNESTLQIRIRPSPRQQIRLPTEFDEEELPPYEPSDSTLPHSHSGFGGFSGSDSGDESDSENSSSTDAHSYDAELSAGGAEVVPMVSLRHQRISRNRRVEQTTHFSSPNQVLSPNSCQTNSRPSVKRSRTFDSHDMMHLRRPKDRRSELAIGADEINRNSDQLLSRNLTNSRLEELGEYERLVSVSPEVCAITGESSVIVPENSKVPHLVNENHYENGPCYENVQAVGLRSEQSNLNALSKSNTVSVSDQRLTSSTSTVEHRVSESTASARFVPIKIVNPSSRFSIDSPSSLRSSFGSPNSAFRPVKPLSQIAPPKNELDTSPYTNCHMSNNFGNSQTNASPLNTPTPTNEACLTNNSLSRNKYVDQGAIPKNVKPISNRGAQKEESSSLSWKNIPLPLSYNHSDSLSNDEEKKLPAKRIPFTESNEDMKIIQINSSVPEQSHSSDQIHIPKCLSSSSPYPHPSLASLPSAIHDTMVNSAPTLSFPGEELAELPKSKERTLITTQPLSPPTQTSSSLNSFLLQSSQDPLLLRPRPPQQRMVVNQPLFQNHKEEMRSVNRSHQSGRWPRSAILLDDRHVNANNGSRLTLSPSLPKGRETSSWLAVDRNHPLSLTSYLRSPASSHQDPNCRQLMSSPPQQPRLGVQLQRRPHHSNFVANMNSADRHQEPHHYPHPNLHSQHQHLQHPPPQQPTQHPPHQPTHHSPPHQPPQLPPDHRERARAQHRPSDNEQQPQRTNRPLFSVLL